MTQRLDAALYAQGFAASRTHARRIVEEGRARVNGAPAQRPSTKIRDTDVLEVCGIPDGGEWASRAALKLLGALDSLDEATTPASAEDALCTGGVCSPIPEENRDDGNSVNRGIVGPHIRRALDIGASTGGFTDVLLRTGVEHVVAVDVGRGQLIPRLAHDPRVTNLEGTDARDLSPELVGEIDLIVSDVSFISLTHLTETIAQLTDENTPVLLMVKPQFEVGKQRVPKSGVVTDPQAWYDAVVAVAESAAHYGLRPHAVIPSAVPGQDGNREFFVHFQLASSGGRLMREEYAMIECGVRASFRGNASGKYEEGEA